MSIYVAFSDESGSGDGEGQFFVAGYVAKETDWPEFSKQWQEKILDPSPTIPYVHMVEIRSEKWRERYGISKAQANERVNSAVRLITGYPTITPYLGTLPEGVYRRTRNWFKEKGFDVKKRHGAADSPCFAAFALAIIHDTAVNKPDVRKINFNISRKAYVENLLRNDVRDALVEYFETYTPELAKLIGDVVPLSMEDHKPLQAADVLCWHLQRISANRVGPDEENNVKLFQERGYCALPLDENAIHEIAINTILQTENEENET
jgi:Protein of unknown function (DUF3800)